MTGKLGTILDKALNVTVALAVGTLVFMILAVTCEIVTRYFLNRPIAALLEITEVSIAYFTFFGAAWVLKEEGHVKVDIVVTRLKPRTRVLLDKITSSVSAILCLIVACYAAWTTWNHFQLGITDTQTMLRIPSVAIVGIVPIGCFLLFAQLLRRILKQAR
ncbi:TRAP transporter small permease [Chloroflexota bacterium]